MLVDEGETQGAASRVSRRQDDFQVPPLASRNVSQEPASFTGLAPPGTANTFGIRSDKGGRSGNLSWGSVWYQYATE